MKSTPTSVGHCQLPALGRRYLTFPDGTTTRSPTFMVLCTKDEALNAYKTFAAWAQTQHGIKFKALRSSTPIASSPSSFSRNAPSVASSGHTSPFYPRSAHPASPLVSRSTTCLPRIVGKKVIEMRFENPHDAIAKHHAKKIGLVLPQPYILSTIADILVGPESRIDQRELRFYLSKSDQTTSTPSILM